MPSPCLRLIFRVRRDADDPSWRGGLVRVGVVLSFRTPKVDWHRFARRVRVPLGFVCGIAFLILARPSGLSLRASLPLVIAGLALRAYAAGTLRKSKALATTGPYAHTRNPLYLGSMLMAGGFAVAIAWWPPAVALVALFYAIYLPTILNEERLLRDEYPGFDDYTRAVPRLIPRFAPARLGEGSKGAFSRAQYLRNHEYEALIGTVAMYAVLVARIYFEKRH